MSLPSDPDNGGRNEEDGKDAGWFYRLAWAFYLLLAVGGVIWIGSRQGRIPVRLFADPDGWWIDLLLGLGTGGGLLLLWALGRDHLASARRLEDMVRKLLGPLDPTEILALALLSGFAEEVFFRGALQGAWGWIPATILFAVLHAGPGAEFRVWTLFAGVAGLAFAWLAILRGNLLAPIVAHMVVNGVNLVRLSRTAPHPEAGS